jgi:hypothetical protein
LRDVHDAASVPPRKTVPTRQRAKGDDIDDFGDIGDAKSSFGRKSVPLQEGFEESIDFDPVGMFQPYRIQETLFDIALNGTSRNSKQLCRFLNGQSIG